MPKAGKKAPLGKKPAPIAFDGPEVAPKMTPKVKAPHGKPGPVGAADAKAKRTKKDAGRKKRGRKV